MSEQAFDLKVHRAFTQWRRWGFAGNHKLNTAWRNQLAVDPLLQGTQFCAELFFGGDRIIRACSGDVPIRTVSGKDGSERIYLPTLGPSRPVIDASYAFGSGSQSTARTFSFTLPEAVVDTRSIINSGRMLAGFGELSMQFDGMDYDNRYVVMRGDMDGGVTFSPGDGGVVEFALTDLRMHADLNLSNWTASEERLGSLIPDATVGQRYPLVFNRYTVPCLDLSNISIAKDFMIAYGHNHTVNAVYVNSESKDSSGDEFGWTIDNEFDALGVPFTRIVISGDHLWDASETVHADVTAAFPNVTTLLDIVEYLARTYTTLGHDGVSFDLFGRAKAKVGTSTIRALINGSGQGTQTRAIEYIESELLSAFPMVSMAWHGSGYGPLLTDRRSTMIRAKLVAGQYPVRDRTSEFQETPKSSLFNNFTFRYNYDIITDIFRSVQTRNPSNSPLCSLSRENAGERHMDPIESVQIFDDGSAGYIMDWLVAHFTLPSIYVEYDCAPSVIFDLDLFLSDNVTITDDDLDWDVIPATIERVALTRGSVTLGLRVWWSYYQLGGGALTQAVT